MKLGKFVKTRRQEMGFSQFTVSKKVKISQGAYSKIENDGMVPTLFIAQRLAKVLGLTLDELAQRRIL